MSNMTMQTLLDAMKLIGPAPMMTNTRVVVDDNVCVKRERVQFRFPKRKSNRLSNRFKKYERNWKFITKEVYFQTPFGLIVSTRMAIELKATRNVYIKKDLW